MTSPSARQDPAPSLLTASQPLPSPQPWLPQLLTGVWREGGVPRGSLRDGWRGRRHVGGCRSGLSLHVGWRVRHRGCLLLLCTTCKGQRRRERETGECSGLGSLGHMAREAAPAKPSLLILPSPWPRPNAHWSQWASCPCLQWSLGQAPTGGGSHTDLFVLQPIETHVFRLSSLWQGEELYEFPQPQKLAFQGRDGSTFAPNSVWGTPPILPEQGETQITEGARRTALRGIPSCSLQQGRSGCRAGGEVYRGQA